MLGLMGGLVIRIMAWEEIGKQKFREFALSEWHQSWLCGDISVVHEYKKLLLLSPCLDPDPGHFAFGGIVPST